MLEDMRRYVRAGLEALSTQGSEDVASAVASRAQAVAEQLSGLAAGFLEWSSEARASLFREVRELVGRQIEEMGLATREDVEALRERVTRLEARTRSPRAPSRQTPRSGARSATAKATRSAPKPTRKSPARSTAKSTAKSSSRPGSPGRGSSGGHSAPLRSTPRPRTSAR